jgi:hypothetical protein
MKTFTEFTNKVSDPATSIAFPTFEEVSQGKDVAGETSSCLTEKMKKLINEMCESGMAEMKACHADETEMTAENWMAEYNSCMKESMDSLKGCYEACMNA